MANPIQGYFDSTSFTLDGNGFPIWNMAVGSEFMAKFAHIVLGNGASALSTAGFQVVKKTGMIVTVKPYFICKNGYMMYQTGETDIEFTSSASEQVFYIGARLDLANNHFTGDDVDAYTTFVSATDVASCRLTITANAVAITDGMITDLRYDSAYCGQIDEYHERGLELLNELETQLAIVMADGIPDHASTHAAGQTDAITPASIGALSGDSEATDIGALPYGAISSNLLINGGFAVNQRGVSGTVTLASGVYGHDRWKGGASGGTYTFATSENVTTLTIASGKSIIQVVEGLNLKSGSVCLSWTGTAQGKIGAGSFGASGITGTAVGGTNLNIEFNAGTVSNVQLSYGEIALPFVPRSYADELRLCQRYAIIPAGAALVVRARAGYIGGNEVGFFIHCPVTLRANPTVRGTAGTNAIVYTMAGAAQTGFSFTATADAWGVSITATKTSHGITDGFMHLTGYAGGLEAEL